MKAIEKLKSAKRFGTRYGKKLKIKVAKIEEESRKIHKCPYCLYQAVKRVSAGIWLCRKCKSKFTGKAYSIKKKISFEEGDNSTELADEKEESKEDDADEPIEDKNDEEKAEL